MSTHQPPDLATIRALCGKLADGPRLPSNTHALAAFEAAKMLPALLDMIDELRTTIELFGDYNVIAAARAKGLLG